MNVGGAGVQGRVKSPKCECVISGLVDQLLSVSLLFRDSPLVLVLAQELLFQRLGKAV